MIEVKAGQGIGTKVQKAVEEESTIDKFLKLHDKVKEVTAELKDLKANKEELESQLIEEFVDNGEQGRKLRDGRNVSIMRKVYASPLAGKKDDMVQALKDQGFGEVVKETVASQTLSSLIKEQEIEEGSGEFPEWVGEVINVCERFTLSVRKGK